MRTPFAWLRITTALACIWSLVVLPIPLTLGPTAAWAQRQPGDAELIAVLELQAVGASEVEASAMTDRLREELLRTGRYTMVDRSQLEAVLNEQALQQTGCTSDECAVQVGQILGVRKIVSGRVNKITDDQWLVSAQMIDVETSQTLRAESLRHRGDFFDLMDVAIVQLAAKLAGTGVVAQPAVPSAAPPPSPLVSAAAPTATPAEDEGWPWWVWTLIGVGVLAGAAAAGGGSEASDPCQSAAGCGSVSISW